MVVFGRLRYSDGRYYVVEIGSGRGGEGGGPNAPSRAVIKLDDAALVVLLDAHTFHFRFARANLSYGGQRRQDRGSFRPLRVDSFVAPGNS